MKGIGKSIASHTNHVQQKTKPRYTFMMLELGVAKLDTARELDTT